MHQPPTNEPLDPTLLEEQIRAVEPAARLVERRWLRRFIRRDLGMPVGSGSAPHERAYRPGRHGLNGGASSGGPADTLFLPAPESDECRPGAAEATRRAYWRALYHDRLDCAVDERFADGRLTDAAIRDFFHQLGPTTGHEIQTLLRGEGLLLPPGDDRVLFREFVAFYHETRAFEPDRFDKYLPSIVDPAAVERALSAHVDAPGLLEATRLPGARLPEALGAEEEAAPVASPASPAAPAPAQRDAYLRKATRAASIGNDARATLLNWQAGDVDAARERLRHLLERLIRAIGSAEHDLWLSCLEPLIAAAAEPGWPVAARMFFDLQRVCVDAERTLYAVDLPEWIVSLGQQPIKRRLDRPREVNVLRHLRAAARRVGHLPLGTEQRQVLGKLMQREVDAAERRVREHLRPVLAGVLDEVGLRPANVAERVARGKLVEELLDRVCERGFLRMSDVRDALARNQLKLSDLSGPVELVRGDPLIRANRLLAVRLDGVYRRGEIYLRWLQRFSSLAFGTAVGRFLTRFVVIPFGGAFVLLEGVQHLVEAVEHGIDFLSGRSAAIRALGAVAGALPAAYARDPDFGSHALATWPAILALGTFLLAVLNVPSFRRAVGRVARTLLLDVPSAVIDSPVVHAVLDNPVTRFVRRYLLVPVLSGAATAVALRAAGGDVEPSLLTGVAVFVMTGGFFRTPFGRDVEERANEALAYFWRVLSVNLVLGLLGLILDFFRLLLERIERAIYAVDERLRFREGEGRLSFWFKLLFGTVWFCVTYVLRFCINILIEPQVNPVKHFPVVTVSHKLLLPLIPSLAGTFGLTLRTTTLIVSGIPGIFGFLVWELKENWKLYRANRSRTLGPVAVGGHGETVRGLLRPGFHSGVVPKTYAKLHAALRDGHERRSRRLTETLHHAAEGIHRFVEREFVACLRLSRRWGGLPLHLEEVTLTPHRLRARLGLGREQTVLVVAIEERAGWLFAALEEPGWLDKLTPKQLAAFTDALNGLYHLAGVHVVREQAAARLGAAAYQADATPDALVVADPAGITVCYTYDEGPALTPEGPASRAAPVAKTELLLTEQRLGWARWVERWEQDQTGKAPLDPLLPGWRLTPPAG